MSAKFQVNRIFRVHGRDAVFASGMIESGVVRIGMVARINIDGGLFWAIPVMSLDYVDVDRAKGIAELALGLDVGGGLADLHGNGFEDLKALCVVGDVIDIEDAAGT